MVNIGYTKFVDSSYNPKSSDLVCEFYIEPGEGISMEEAAGAVASESSVGTWTEISTSKPSVWKMAAKVFEIRGNFVKIAYPAELFEPGNMPQIFSSVCGNIFGMKEVGNLRIEDIHWSEKIMHSFYGPYYGVQGIRKLLKIKNRPLCGTIVKPKLGLSAEEHAECCYEAWTGGLDGTKDDENLTSMSFNQFKRRIKKTLQMRDKAEKETGERKFYMANVTAETREMIKRAKFIKDCGGDYMMVDVLTVGWSGLQTLREENEKLKLVMHGHRAMHGALTRNKKHGISMMVIADACRLIGIDQLHIGTAVGKMEGTKKEITNLGEEIEHKMIKEHGHVLSENWGKIKPTFAVCSGGLQPGHVPALVKMLGNDIIIQAGGGVWGNPLGGKAGAAAMRQAIDSVVKNITLKEYAETHKELKAAIDKWGIWGE